MKQYGPAGEGGAFIQECICPCRGWMYRLWLSNLFLDDWGGDHWLPQIGLRSLGHGSTLLTGSVGAISSDYCHENHSVMSESSRCHTICVLQELFTTKFESKGKICTHTYVQYYTHSHNIKMGYMLLNL